MINAKDFRAIDYKKTKKAVIAKVSRYEKALMRVDTGHRPKITQSYDISMSGGGFNSKTEKAGIYAAEGANEDLEYLIEFVGVVNRLNEQLKEVFIRTYIQEQTHIKTANDMHISTTKLSALKRDATELFAYGMDCEIKHSK